MFSNLLKWGHNRHYNRGMVHFNRGEYGQAAAEFESALGEVRDPSEPDHSLALCYAAEARGNLGLAFFHAGQYAKAEEQFAKALEENPTFPDLRYYLARIYQRSGRLKKAIAELDQGLRDPPGLQQQPRQAAVQVGVAGLPGHRQLELGDRAREVPRVVALQRPVQVGDLRRGGRGAARQHGQQPLPVRGSPLRGTRGRQPLGQLDPEGQRLVQRLDLALAIVGLRVADRQEQQRLGVARVL